MDEREYPENNERASGMVETQPGRISVTLPAVPQSMAAARRAADALIGDTPATEQFRFFLRLAVSELVTNAIVHGYPRDDIRVDLALYRRHAHVSVTSRAILAMTKLRDTLSSVEERA